MENTDIQQTSRQYKDTVFRALFGDSKRFLELYNAVADEHFPEDTIVTPFEPNSLLARFKDIAALVGSQLIIFFEQQSTPSLNMPLRLLRYVTNELYSQVIDPEKLYRSKQVKIPTPRFYVLYNGEQKLDYQVLKLSDAFILDDSEPALELTAKIININYESGEAAFDRSASLQGYAFLVAEIRKNIRSGMTRDNAIIAAIELCIKQDVLKAFLKDHFEEVVKMLNYEYDAEAENN